MYHYTSTEGLLGILNSGQLRATDLRYLNDTSELHFGLAEMLSRYELTSQSPNRRTPFSDNLAKRYKIENWKDLGTLTAYEAGRLPRDRFDPIARAIVNSLEETMLIGVACFCGNGDLLSQWRGYGAAGYALGFDAQDLRHIVRQRYLPLTSVTYGRAAARQPLRRVDDLLDQAPAQASGRLPKHVTLSLLGMAAQIKDPAFESENEFRIGDVAAEDLQRWKYRGGSLGVVPYLDIDLRKPDTDLMPLREIFLAPGPEVALRETAVRALLRTRGYPVSGSGGVNVKPSSIPFRG